MTMKPGLSQNNLKANGTGAFHISNQSDLMSEDMHVLDDKLKHHASPSKYCTDETSVNKSLNFGDFQAQNQCRNGTRQKVTVKSEIKEPRSVQIPGNRLTNHHVKPSKSCTEETSVNESLSFGKAQEECHDVHVHVTRQSITVKRELTGARADQFPENRMTNLRERSLVWGAVKSGNNSEANGQNKSRASVSSVCEGIPVVNCDMKITIVQKLLLSIFISCSLYFVCFVNCFLNFVRFSTLLVKISITISIWLDYQPLFGN